MKRSKTLIILAAVLAVIIVAIVVVKSVERHVDELAMVDEIILTTSPDSVTALSWKTDTGSLSFVKNDGVWYNTEDQDFPVDQDKISEFLSKYEEVHASFIIDDIEDYSQYGLVEPKCTVTITSGDTVSEVSMGSYSTMDSKRYISTGDGRAFLIDDDLYTYVSIVRDDYMKNDEIPAVETVESFTITGASELSAIYDPDAVYCYTNAYNYYTSDKLALSDELVESFLSTLGGLQLTEYATYKASSDNLADYALADPMLTITVSGYNTVESEDSSDDEGEKEPVEYTVNFGYVVTGTDDDGNETGDTYVRMGDSEIIYKLDGSTYETFASTCYNTLRPEKVLSLSWDSVLKLVSVIGEEEHTVNIIKVEDDDEADQAKADDGTIWKDEDRDGVVYALDGSYEFDDSALVSALDGMKISEFNDIKPEGELELTIKVHVSDNIAYSPVTVEIYRYDGDSCLVTFNSETVGLMPRSMMVDLKEALTSVILNSQSES